MSEVKRYWIYKGTSNFCQNLTLDDDCETMVRQKPDGFYDIVSTNDTVEGGVEVVLASDYEKLKAQLERAESVLKHFSLEHKSEQDLVENTELTSESGSGNEDDYFMCGILQADAYTALKAREYFKEKEQVWANLKISRSWG